MISYLKSIRVEAGDSFREFKNYVCTSFPLGAVVKSCISEYLVDEGITILDLPNTVIV